MLPAHCPVVGGRVGEGGQEQHGEPKLIGADATWAGSLFWLWQT